MNTIEQENKQCMRCNIETETAFDWSFESKVTGRERVILCEECCKHLVHKLLLTDDYKYFRYVFDKMVEHAHPNR